MYSSLWKNRAIFYFLSFRSTLRITIEKTLVLKSSFIIPRAILITLEKTDSCYVGMTYCRVLNFWEQQHKVIWNPAEANYVFVTSQS